MKIEEWRKRIKISETEKLINYDQNSKVVMILEAKDCL